MYKVNEALLCQKKQIDSRLQSVLVDVRKMTNYQASKAWVRRLFDILPHL
jgi:hypothetical protein